MWRILQVFRFAIVCSILQRILLRAVLNSFSQSRRSRCEWFSDGGDHAEVEVAFVADPVVGIDPVQDARAAQRRAVVAAALDGFGDPAQLTGQVADHWEVQAGRVVLAGVELRVVFPAPAADQGAIDDQLLVAGQFLGGRGERTHRPRQPGVIAVIAREIVDWDTP